MSPPKHKNIPYFQQKPQHTRTFTYTHTLLYLLSNAVHNLLEGYILKNSAFHEGSGKGKCYCLSFVK